MKSFIYDVALLLTTIGFFYSCSKDDDNSSTIVGTWNKEAIDVYFDGQLLETSYYHSDDEGPGDVVDFNEDYTYLSLEFFMPQIIFKSNGIVTCLGIEGKYEVKGNDVYVNNKKELILED